MDERTWDAAILKLFEFFRVEKLPTKKQQDLWFQFVKHIGNNEVDEIISGITSDYDSLPRNISKAFIEHRPSKSYTSRQVQYDPIEDFRFPVGLMQKSLDVLLNQGFTAYNAYALSVKMPQKDRDRVEYKAQIIRQGQNPHQKISDLINTTYSQKSGA